MRRLPRLVAACLAAMLLAHASVPAAARWREVRTPNFLLIGDARAGDMRRIAARFEQFYGAMEALGSRAAVASPVPTVVLVFSSEASFRPYMPLRDGKRVDVAGIFWSGRGINYVGINAQYGEQAYPIVFHELTHVLAANLRRRTPLWLTEGIAEYHSTFAVRGASEILLGAPIDDHTRLLHQQFMPLAELLAVDAQSPIYNEGPRRRLFYAQSWALVHFLRGNPETRGRLSTYLRTLDAGADQETALRDVFGFEVRELQDRLRSYVRQFSVPGELWKLARPVADGTFSAADISESVALTHLGRLLLRAGRLQDAEQRLGAALAAAPRLALAHAAMAELRLEQDRAADGWPHLGTATESAGDFFDSYLTASMLREYLDEAPDEDRRRAALAWLRGTSRAAAEARPDVAEAWHLVALGAERSGDREQAAHAAERAANLAPGNEEYRFTLADVLSQQGEFGRARALLGELMGRGRTDMTRALARKLMGLVVRREDYAKLAGPGVELPGSSDAIPAFRTLQPGETRAAGLLTTIECTPGGVTLVLATDNRTLRITLPGFEAIEFITYRDDLSGQVTCAPRTPPDRVLVTWQGGDAPADGAVQTLRAVVEFTPRPTRAAGGR